MKVNGNEWNRGYRKSARIVGDVIGKYHPHGETAIYDAMVRMAQDFAMRLPLIDGQGNFGSMDGDAAAAYRYTEARLARVADTLPITIDELMQYVPAPDFPTGGIIMGRAGTHAAYRTGRGAVVTRAKSHVEEIRKDREAIVFTELPYQVNKAKLVERIAETVREKLIDGISDLRDESDREGLRVVVELKRDAEPDIVLNQLYRHTALQTSFG